MLEVKHRRSALLTILAAGLVCVAPSCGRGPAIGPRLGSKLAFTVQPSNTLAGAAISPAVVVAVQDVQGNTVTTATTSITLAIGTNPGNGALSGAATAAAVAGVATFSGLSIDKAGTGYTLTAAASGLTDGGSAAFNVEAGVASTLAFTVQPNAPWAEQAISPGIQVSVQDALGNTVPSATNTITIAIATGTAEATLGGTKTQTALGGVATFADIALDKAGIGYTLAAVSQGLTSATSAPFNVDALASLSAGAYHTCALTTGGTAYCWGWGGDGLGHGSTRTSYTPVMVVGGLTFATVSASEYYTCGVTTAGGAYCWGDNYDGQLGNGSLTVSSTPVAVSGGLTFTSVSAGSDHACGVTTSGTAYCWGRNDYGQLGDGSTTRRSTPVAVSGGLTLVSVTAGYSHACGVTSGGKAYCWGGNVEGALGNGSMTGPENCSVGGWNWSCSRTPVPVAGGLTFTAVSASTNFSSCGIATGGAAYCWGRNSDGSLGSGSWANVSTPVAVSGGLNFAAVSGGRMHTCGVTAGSAAYCWGEAYPGKLGDGSISFGQSPTPVAVVGGHAFGPMIGLGFYHTCALTTGGAAYCWGDNRDSQLGNGSSSYSSTPLRVVMP